MKKALFLLLVLLAMAMMAASSRAQEFLREYPRTETLWVLPQGNVIKEDIYAVHLRAGRNTFHLAHPDEGIDPRLVEFSIAEGRLLRLFYDTENRATFIVHAEGDMTTHIRLRYPVSSLATQFLYQVVENDSSFSVQVFLHLQNHGLSSHENALLRVFDREFPLTLPSQGTQSIRVATLTADFAEKTIEYRNGESKFFLSLRLPPRFLIPARVEYFTQKDGQVTFLGEGHLTPEGGFLKLPLGIAQDLIVEETITHRGKENQVFAEDGQELLYDTREEKRYHLENRGVEPKKVVVFDTAVGSFRVITSTVPVTRENFDRISFTITLSPQEEKDITVTVEGLKLTSGWVFEE